MTERNVFPKIPRWCPPICHNALNDLCIEDCAEFRDARHFEPKNIDIEDAPRFPRSEFEEEMGNKEGKKCLAFYMERMVDKAQGIRHEPRVLRSRSAKVDVPHKEVFLSDF